MKWLLAMLLVRARGLINWVRPGHPDVGGLTVPCHGCESPWPHDAHLARGALTFLGGRR